MIEELRKLFAPHPDTPDISGFRFADLFDNERWRTTDRPSYGSKRDERIEFREYVPRPKKDVTEKVTIGDDGKRTKTITSKYVDVGETYGFPINDRQFRPDDGMGANSYYSPPSLPYERLADTRDAGLTPSRFMPSTFAEEGPGMGSYAPWSDRAGARPPMEFGPARTTGNPFGYPMRTAIQGPPRYTDVYQEMQGATPMMPISNYRRSPYGYTPMEMPAAPPISGIGTTHGRLPVGGSRITPSVPSGLHPGWETGYGMASPVYGDTAIGAITPFEPAPQSTLDRFPNSPVGMSDAVRRRMLELILTDPSIILERSD